jgi:hypothetical protein
MKRWRLATVVVMVTLGCAARPARAQAPPRASAPAPSSPAAPSAPAKPAQGSVRINVRTEEGAGAARVYWQPGSDGQWTFACASPCRADVKPGTDLRVTLGNDEDHPQTFTLPSDQGREVDVLVQPASKGPKIAGIIMIPVGFSLAGIGLLLVSLSYSSGLLKSPDSRVPGFALLGTGLAIGTGGILLLALRSKDPRVEVEGREPDKAKDGPKEPGPAQPPAKSNEQILKREEPRPSATTTVMGEPLPAVVTPAGFGFVW